MPDSARICIATMLLFLAACQPDSKVASTNQAQQQEPFIHPAFKGVDIAYETYLLQAEKGGVIYHPSGSILEFPANSLVDKNGQPITGKVNISYREFSDPIDFFVAGIPMEYTEGGTKYTFESSGMCDIRADKDGMPVFINPANKPSVHIVSHNSDTSHNVYYLDTVQKKWIPQGKDFIYYEDKNKNLKNIDNVKVGNVDTQVIVKPLLPKKASPNKPVIKLEIDPASVPELLVYNNLQFEIDDDKWDVSDTAQQWDDIKVEKGNATGNYKVGLQSGAVVKWYNAKPVLQGKDYTDAMKIYDAKMQDYNALYSARLERERKFSVEVELKREALKENQKKLQEEQLRVEEMNKLVLARNKEWERRDLEIQLLNKKTVERNVARKKEMEEQNKKQQEENEKQLLEWKRQVEIYKKKQQEYDKQLADFKRKEEEWKNREQEINEQQAEAFRKMKTYDKVMRSFKLERFGILNCDGFYQQNDILIEANFVEQNNRPITLNPITVVYRNINSLVAYSSNPIKLNPFNENIIFGVEENKLVYLTYEQLKQYDFSNKKRKYSFEMNVSQEEIKSVDDVKHILKY